MFIFNKYRRNDKNGNKPQMPNNPKDKIVEMKSEGPKCNLTR